MFLFFSASYLLPKKKQGDTQNSQMKAYQ